MKKNRYLVIGSGNMADHFTHYLDLEKIPFMRWKRKDPDLTNKVKEATTIFVLISDDSIEEFVDKLENIDNKTVVHFSGALNIPGIIGFHPLMSFGKSLYTLKEYRDIPFIGISSSELFKQILPDLKNSYYKIDKRQKSYYHALCVIGGNFSSILWQKVIQDFAKELSLPETVLKPYITRVFTNILEDSKNSLTGPVKRQDLITIRKNKNSLNRTWRKIYSLFNKAYLKEIR